MTERRPTYDPDVMTVLERWWDHPEAMVREEFGVEPDPWQLEALQAFPHRANHAYKACKGPGKTALLAWLILNFLATRPHARINAASITQANLEGNLWPELAKWLGKSTFLKNTFEHTATRVVHKHHPKTWWCHARSWAKAADADKQSDSAAGLHEDYAMWVFDESGSMAKAVLAMAEAVHASGVETKVVQAGNPTSRDGMLYQAAVVDRANWFVVTITGDPDDPQRSPRINRDWAQGQIDKYGRDNPWVRVNVFGEFPASALNALLGDEEVLASMRRRLEPAVYEWAQKRLGVDVARFGDDRDVFFPRQGLRAFNPRVERFPRDSAVSNLIAGVILGAKARWGSEVEFMDATGGWGAGARDILLTGGVSVIEVQFHGQANDPRYENRRAEMWFQGADWIKRGGWLPNWPELVAELTTPTYTFSHRGKFLLEPKELVKERLLRSPDLADALMLTFAQPDMPGGLAGHGTGQAARAIDAEAERPRGYTEERGMLRRRVQPEPFDGAGRADRAGDEEE